MTRLASPSNDTHANPPAKRAVKKLKARTRELMQQEISFVLNRDDLQPGAPAIEHLDEFLEQFAPSEACLERQDLVLLPSATGPILGREDEQRLFRHMNFLKWRANALRSQLDPGRPSRRRVEAIGRLLHDAERIRAVLAECNLRLVLSIAGKHSNSRQQFEEFVSEGFTILLRCVNLFDVSRGFRFSTYLTHAVQRHLYRCLLKSQKLRKRQAATDVDILNNVPGPEAEVGPEVDASLLCHRILDEAAGRLDLRETTIITRRFGLDGLKRQNLREIADDLGLSKERVRQLQMRALKKLQDVAASLNVSLA